MNLRTVKSIAGLVLTGTASVLVMAFKTTPEPVADTSTFVAPTSSSSPSSGTAQTPADPTATPSSGGSGGVVAGATYADGTWTGSAVDEPWGTFEVKAVVTGGKITDVVLVASPTDRHSRSINRQAVPLLTESAIATQSANVDMVSGATWSSESYATSLQAALDAAKAAL